MQNYAAKNNIHSTLTQSGLFTREQIADYIGLSTDNIQHGATKRIPVIKFGGSVRFDPGKVLTALEKYEIESI